jgi:hypothetical protein
VQQVVAAQLVQVPAGADQHPDQTVLDVFLLPGKRATVAGQLPQLLNTVQVGEPQKVARADPAARVQQPAVGRPQHAALQQRVHATLRRRSLARGRSELL